MPCFWPKTAYYAPGGEDGKRRLTFSRREAYEDLIDQAVPLPCGRCDFCLKKRANAWMVRNIHEMASHNQCQFLTLTYAPDKLPAHGSLQMSDHKNFMKRYRKEADSRARRKLKFFMCGEYGETTERAHYHYLIFGHMFGDREEVENTPGGNKQWQSQALTKIWGKGRCRIGVANPKSAAYVSGYILKKQFGADGDKTYEVPEPDPETGEIYSRLPPFQCSSKELGLRWIEKNYKEIYPSNFVIIAGKKCAPPEFYDKWLEAKHPELHREVRQMRKAHKREIKRDLDLKGEKSDHSKERQLVIEKVARAQRERFKRDGI